MVWLQKHLNWISTCSKVAQTGVHLLVRLAEVVKRQFLLRYGMCEALTVEAAANIHKNLRQATSETK